ncbi:UDP-3-O-(3-hydroxymyristoyl)glucosamine N-acyltransferase [Desulfobacterales bacterium HSG17]|nr:UDP-3-O-(3-hydroxymyristoyl)glucosamine N-acyltransferase [Desulfobacterales bacterium HSG17]
MPNTPKNYTVAEIALEVNGNLTGSVDKRIIAVKPFDEAGPDDITCAMDSRYLSRLDETEAGVIIVPTRFDAKQRAVIKTDNPYLAFAKVLALFHPRISPGVGIDPKAGVSDDLIHGTDIYVGYGVFIGRNVTMGKRVCIHPNCYIGSNVTIGDDVWLMPNVTIMDGCILGDRVTVNSGSVIGSDGFGFAPDGESYCKIPQVGFVKIGDDVEIGAGNTIDRATIGITEIGNGVKTDNLVQIAHNVQIGENTVVVAQTGIAGSVRIGKNVAIGGQAGIAGHVEIGDHAKIAGQSGVSRSVRKGAIVSGTPAVPHGLWLRVQSVISGLPDLKKKIGLLEKKVNDLVSGK